MGGWLQLGSVVNGIIAHAKTLMSILFPNAITRLNWEKHGETPSVKDWGAVGDVQVLSATTIASATTISATFANGGNFLPTDVGKRIIIYGAGPAAGRETFSASAVGAINTTNSYTVVCEMDAQSAVKVEFAGNCSLNNVTWEVFGANLSNYSDEVIISGPTTITALAASISYVETTPLHRYYRVKALSTVSGQSGTIYVTCVALGWVLGTTIASYISSTSVTLSTAPSFSMDTAYAYFGTDDTAAIQLAINTANTFVNPGTADGGIKIDVPRGNYLISSPITHKQGVVVRGDSSGASIFYVDGAAFPLTSAAWSMTGTFPSDSAIAFFTRLEDVRIDCGHVPGSIAVFCDALQEQSGLVRVTGIQWLQYGLQAGSSSDQYGNSNWIVEDPYFYPSVTAFFDDTVCGASLSYAPLTTIRRGTFMGQGGYICGYGKSIEVSFGDLQAHGNLHFESARIGLHFNTGSSGMGSGIGTQSFVQAAVQIDSGNPILILQVASAGLYSIIDNVIGNTLSQSAVPFYSTGPSNLPTLLGNNLQMPADPSNPNVITWNALNFAEDTQGGFLSVNSMAVGFPNWTKTSSNASNNALFFILSPQGIDVRTGPPNQPVYVAQGSCNVSGTAITWVSGTTFNTSWPVGTQIVLAGSIVALIASVGSSTSLTITASAGTFTGVSFGVSTDITALGGTQPGTSLFSVYKGVGAKFPTGFGSLVSLGAPSPNESNWQTDMTPGTTGKKVIWASNIYWNAITGVWEIPVDGYGGSDWAALVMYSGGNVGIVMANGVVPPTTISDAAFDAAHTILFNVNGGATFFGDGASWVFGSSSGISGANILEILSSSQLVKLLLSGGSGKITNSAGPLTIENLSGTGDLDITQSANGNLNLTAPSNKQINLTAGTPLISMDGSADTAFIGAGGVNIELITALIKLNGLLRFGSYGAGALVTDASGNVSAAVGLSVTITTAKLTSGGTNGSQTFVNGILTAQTPAT